MGLTRGGKRGGRGTSGAERFDKVLDQKPVGASVERAVRQGREILRPSVDLQGNPLCPEDAV